MKQTYTTHKSIYYPPGGILIWMIIVLELLTFGMAILALVFQASKEVELYHESRLLLNSTIGAINTIVLISSGFCMAQSLKFLKSANYTLSKHYLLFTMLGGLLFFVLKGIEYYDKINAGYTLSYNGFFSYYWLLTLFHLLHVLVGLVILGVLYYKIYKTPENVQIIDAETSAAFWHMCDLIWLLLFPILYLTL